MAIWPTDNIWQSDFNMDFTRVTAMGCGQKVAILFLPQDVRQLYLHSDTSWGKGKERFHFWQWQ